MTPKKTIIFAFESRKILSSVLAVVHENDDLNYIIASRISDVISILKTERPSLIVFGFYNNQEAVSMLCRLSGSQKIPLLCLSNEREILRWGPDSIVFTLPLNSSLQEDLLSAYMNSILMLSANKSDIRRPTTLLDNSLRRSFVHQDGQLSKYVMELEKKKSILVNIKKRIKELHIDADPATKKRLLSILNMIRNEIQSEKRNEDFNDYFNKIHPMFLNRLHSRHPGLTPKDIKYCCYLSLNMSNHEIRNLLGINQESVRTHQYRLKKKLSLPKEVSLRGYVNNLALKKVN